MKIVETARIWDVYCEAVARQQERASVVKAEAGEQPLVAPVTGEDLDEEALHTGGLHGEGFRRG